MREMEIIHFQGRQCWVFQPLIYTKETNIFLFKSIYTLRAQQMEFLALQGKALLSEETQRTK